MKFILISVSADEENQIDLTSFHHLLSISNSTALALSTFHSGAALLITDHLLKLRLSLLNKKIDFYTNSGFFRGMRRPVSLDFDIMLKMLSYADINGLYIVHSVFD